MFSYLHGLHVVIPRLMVRSGRGVLFWERGGGNFLKRGGVDFYIIIIQKRYLL